MRSAASMAGRAAEQSQRQLTRPGRWQTVGVTEQLDKLDFPVLVLDGGELSPRLCIVGGDGSLGLSDVGVGYGTTSSGDSALTLRTMVRRGHRIGPGGHAGWIATELRDMAEHAVCNLLLAQTAGLPQGELRAAGEAAVVRGRELADLCYRPPWLSGQVDVDGVAYQLVTIELDGGFAAAADLGPVVLAAWGRDLSAWSWRLTAAAPETLRKLLDGSTG
jgi:hypothetical protein